MHKLHGSFFTQYLSIYLSIRVCVCKNMVRELLRAPKLSQGKLNSPTQKQHLIIKTKPWQWPKGDENLE